MVAKSVLREVSSTHTRVIIIMPSIVPFICLSPKANILQDPTSKRIKQLQQEKVYVAAM